MTYLNIKINILTDGYECWVNDHYYMSNSLDKVLTFIKSQQK